jgi:hypothetical protein
LDDSLREAQKIYVRWDEENKNRRLKLCYPHWGRTTQKKSASQRVGYKRTSKPQIGRQDSQTPGVKKGNKCYQHGKLEHFK